MLQYLLTGIAGIVLGIVVMRVWQSRDPASGTAESLADVAAGAESSPAEGAPPTGISSRKLLAGAAALTVAAVAILLLRGTGAEPQGSATPAPAAGSSQQVTDVDSMIARLAERLAKNPNDGEGFRMLGWSYVMTGKPAEALAPYRRALTLLPNRADVHAGLGEALAGANGGKVSSEAKTEFERAIAIKPDEPRARYFMALWQAQNGQEREAVDKWIALANSAPADAPWQADVRQQITATSARLGIDVSARLTGTAPAAPVAAVGQPPVIPPAAVDAAGKLPEPQRQAMVDQMVEGLANRLKANPNDPEGWARLLRSRMVLQQAEQAGRDLEIARIALKGNAAGLARVNAAARELSVPGA
jgi:cytochrome c-type biogenesis protein CcmH